jgi:hypothetical protein
MAAIMRSAAAVASGFLAAKEIDPLLRISR